MSSFLTKLDFFGQPIHLTYAKKNTFKTALGGLSTLILMTITLGYFTSHAIHLFGNEIESIHEENRWENNDNSLYAPGSAGFNIGIGFDTVKLDKSIGKWQFRLVSVINNQKKVTKLAHFPCKRKEWEPSSYSKFQGKICTDISKLEIFGDNASEYF
jgi:hypothetical protein